MSRMSELACYDGSVPSHEIPERKASVFFLVQVPQNVEVPQTDLRCLLWTVSQFYLPIAT